MNREGLIQIVTNMVSNFTGFAPLGIVVVTMIGIGVAENSGLISALMKKTVLSAPKKSSCLLFYLQVLSGMLPLTQPSLFYLQLPP